MKILHLISSSGLYGAERMILSLSKTLNQTGHPTHIGVFQNSHAPNTELASDAAVEKLPVTLIPCDGRFDRAALATLRNLIQENTSEVIHAHGYKADIYAYLAARNMNRALISTCHTWYDNDFRVYLYGVMDRWILRRFDQTVAVSDSVASQLRKAGVAENKINVIANGINTAAFWNAPRSSSLAEPLIGLVGRLAPEKGVADYLRAAKIVVASHPKARFAVFGDGPDKDSLQAQARLLGIEQLVRFAGKVTEMPSVYRSLDILVSSSIKEGMPMTLLEGMAAGLPIVATSVGAVPKVIVHEQTGLLAPAEDPEALANAIMRMLDDSELRFQLAVKGQKTVQERFSAESMTESYLELYKQAVRQRIGH